jgi:hypothetical protein
MIPKKPAPDLIGGGNRFSEKIMLKRKTSGSVTIRRWPVPAIADNVLSLLLNEDFRCDA